MLRTGQVRDIEVSEHAVSLTLALSSHSAPLWTEWETRLRQAVREAFPGISAVTVTRDVEVRPPQRLGEIGLTAKSVIAVGSGKGGVGKSTIAASLALGLKRAGCEVGLLDADVYGPSIPHLLGSQGRPEIVAQQDPADLLGRDAGHVDGVSGAAR